MVESMTKKAILPQVWKRAGDSHYANAKVLCKSLDTERYKCAVNESIIIDQVRNGWGSVISNNYLIKRSSITEDKILRDDLDFLRLQHMKLELKTEQEQEETIVVTPLP